MKTVYCSPIAIFVVEDMNIRHSSPCPLGVLHAQPADAKYSIASPSSRCLAFMLLYREVLSRKMRKKVFTLSTVKIKLIVDVKASKDFKVR